MGQTQLSPLFRRAAALTLLAAALCSSVGCASTAICKDAWLGRDKAEHFAAGFAIGAIPSTLAAHSGWGPGRVTALGLGAAASAGAGKEAYDLKVKRTCWSWKDFAWDLLGGILGTATGIAATSAGD